MPLLCGILDGRYIPKSGLTGDPGIREEGDRGCQIQENWQESQWQKR